MSANFPTMQENNPALRPSDLAIVKVLNTARLAALRKENSQPDDVDVEAIKIEAFFAAIKAGNLKYIKKSYISALLAELDVEGLTPVGVAIKYGQYGVAKYLLEQYKDGAARKKAGADVSALDYRRNTPLHYAVCKNDIILVRILLTNGAKGGIKNKKYDTPLSLCMYSTESEKIKNILFPHNLCNLLLVKKVTLGSLLLSAKAVANKAAKASKPIKRLDIDRPSEVK